MLPLMSYTDDVISHVTDDVISHVTHVTYDTNRHLMVQHLRKAAMLP